MWGDTEALRSQLVARADSLAELNAALDTGRGSAVVVGPAGIGKTALVRAAAAGSDFHVVNIRGSKTSGPTPFGALAWLLYDLPEGITARPVQLLQQLEILLTKQAGGRRVLLLLDNAEFLDDLTAMAVAQLVRRSTVRVLATAENLAAAPSDFLALWTDGLLHRIDLSPFALGETQTLMESLLGGRVSAIAAQAMQHHSDGNPHLIRLTTPAQAAGKSLVRQDGVWVLAKPLVYSTQVGEVMAARLKRLAPQERTLVEVLALAGGLPLPAVVQLVGADAVEALEEARIVEVTATGSARLSEFSTSAAIAGSVPPGRSRELWEEISAILDPEQLDPAALAGFAGWTMACRGRLAPVTALRAASLAINAEDPDSALKFLRSVPAGRRTPAMVLEEVRALASSGDNRQALHVLERFDAKGIPAGRRIGTALLLHKAVLLRLLPARGDPWRTLGQAEALLHSPEQNQEQDHDENQERQQNDPAHNETDPVPENASLEAAVLLTRGTLAIDAGRLSEVPAGLARIPCTPGLSPAVRALGTGQRIQILALSGRAGEAVVLADQLAGGSGAALNPRSRNQTYARIFQALIAAGELRRAGQLAAELVDGGTRQAFRGSSGEVAAGLVHALAGRADKAQRALTAAVSQLRVQDPTDVLPLARAVAAYVCALQEDHTAAKQHLADAADFAYQPSAPIRLLTERMRLQAELAEDREALGRQLRAMARTCQAAGMVPTALDCLTAAARAGDPDAARELAEAAARAGGTWARAQFCFGAGLAGADPALLLESAQLSLELENHLQCHAAAVAALGLLQGRRGTPARSQTQTAQRLEHASFRELRDANSTEARLEKLSPFEADLARRAAGPATREALGSALNLSPRTIDWHLGKIFDKLRVSGRAELIEILS